MDDNNADLASLVTLPSIFEGRLFRIPDYQRGYAWGSPQVKALLDDVEQLFDHEHTHYTGTLVILRKDNASHADAEHGVIHEIIDGQQRLTTFSILLACLTRELDDDLQKDQMSSLYLQRGDSGNQTRVLKLNRNIDPFYLSCILENKQPKEELQFISEKYLINARSKVNTWIEQQVEKGRSRQEILKLITTKFGFLVYCPKQTEEAGMMFEVINNRGKPLSELDKIKNYLVYYSIKLKKRNLQEKVNQHWGIILRNLAKAHNLKQPDEEALLRASVVCYFGFSKDQCSNIYETLKKKFPLADAGDQWLELAKFVEFLSRASSYYECVLNDSSTMRGALNDKEIVEQIERIRSQSAHASTMPLFFAIMEARDRLSKDKVIDLLRMIEILTFRVFMTRNGAKRTDSGQADLYSFAHKLYTDEISWKKKCEADEGLVCEDVVGMIIARLHGFIAFYSSDERFEEGLELRSADADDFFNWSGLLYFLMNYEQHIDPKRTIKIDDILRGRTTGKSNDTPSVEHIWAQKHHLNGANFIQEEDRRSKRRLGNFALLELGINVQASNSDLTKKIDIYEGKNSTGDKSKFKQIHLLIEDYEKVLAKTNGEYSKKVPNFYRKVTVRTLDKNEKRYIEFAKTRWSIDWARRYWRSASDV